MPNWCENDLYVRGTKEELVKFMEAVKGEDRHGCQKLICEDKIIPYPEEFRELDRVAAEYEKQHPGNLANAPKDGFNQGGYEWCIENWGTKWGFCDIELVEESDDEIQYTFRTAWSPPRPLIRKLGEMFPSLEFDLRYFEAGMEFNGTLRIVGGEVEREEEGAYFGDRGG